MDLSNTRTLECLGRAFAGESQAQARYRIYAEQARTNGLIILASLIERVASNEQAHAKVFFDLITGNVPGPIPNLPISGGFPFKVGDDGQNMLFAMEGEREEHTVVYPEFARIAAEEGFAPVSDAFTRIASIEQHHAAFFEEVHGLLAGGNLYRRPQPVSWRCSHCGYEAILTQPWQTCPVCGRKQGYVEIPLTNQV